jgi:soluble lytic murein transglycosylase-like protein
VDALQMPQLDGLLQGARARAEQARVAALAAGADTVGLEKTAREFEGVFLNQLLNAMRSTVPENELFNGSGATKFYRQMHDAELARGLAGGHNGLGISQLIVDQFADAVAREDATAGPQPTALARYRVFGAEADAPRRREEIAAVGRRSGPAELDTLRRYGDDLSVAATRHGVAPALLLAVVMEESGGDPDAVSERGARGLMQLMPETAAEMGVADPSQPGTNLAGGARYLSQQIERFGGRLDLALAAYNAGPGAVESAGGAVPAFSETRRYVERVLDRYHRLAGGTDLATEGR